MDCWRRGQCVNPTIDGARDNQGRFHVDENLQVRGMPDVFATGDVADAAKDDVGNTALMTCQHAIQLGKFAGNKVAASVMDSPPILYRQVNYVTCLDLGSWSAIFTEGWDKKCKRFVKKQRKSKSRSPMS